MLSKVHTDTKVGITRQRKWLDTIFYSVMHRFVGSPGRRDIGRKTPARWRLELLLVEQGAAECTGLWWVFTAPEGSTSSYRHRTRGLGHSSSHLYMGSTSRQTMSVVDNSKCMQCVQGSVKFSWEKIITTFHQSLIWVPISSILNTYVS